MPLSFLVAMAVAVAIGAAANEESQNIGTLLPRPVMAWNTWNKFACNVSESLIRTAADQLVSLGLRDLGYQYVNMDDCWQAENRDSIGRVQADPTRFPAGLKELSDYIHSMELKFGIYSSAGFHTCAAKGVYPASLGMESVDAEQYAVWGVDYLKYDNCMEDKGRPDKRYPPMADALQETNRNIALSLCEWGRENPAVWGAQIGASSWRTSNDIKDDWNSVISRAAIDGPLWRYAGAAYKGGWNDPDMLEVGNGGCTDDEYRTHFSLWCILKAPLILGMDLGALTRESVAYAIVSNKAAISINQDAAGLQARRVFSDVISKTDDASDRLIATKCAWNEKSYVYQDSPDDQQWILREDGRIESGNTGRCLVENKHSDIIVDAAEATTTAFHDFLDMDSNVEFSGSKEDIEAALAGGFGERAVTSGDCTTKGTKFEFYSGKSGGSIISEETGKCLEVSTISQFPLWQGKRIQTSTCDHIIRIGSETAIFGYDTQEHQSWVLDKRSTKSSGFLKNLYQRQCLTVDRDAPKGKQYEVWQAPLEGGDIAVLFINLSQETLQEQQITLEQLQIDVSASFTAIVDIWESSDYQFVNGGISFKSIPPHGSAFIRLSSK